MDRKGIMLNEISQTEKDRCSMISLVFEKKQKQTYRNREQIGGCQREGVGEMGEGGSQKV